MPQGADEFICSSCFLVYHRPRSHANGPPAILRRLRSLPGKGPGPSALMKLRGCRVPGRCPSRRLAGEGRGRRGRHVRNLGRCRAPSRFRAVNPAGCTVVQQDHGTLTRVPLRAVGCQATGSGSEPGGASEAGQWRLLGSGPLPASAVLPEKPTPLVKRRNTARFMSFATVWGAGDQGDMPPARPSGGFAVRVARGYPGLSMQR